MARRPPLAQTAAAPSGRPGTARKSLGRPAQEHLEYRRNGRTILRSARKTPSSKRHKWARMRDAAESSRRGHKRKGGERNSRNPWDFAAHEPPRANGKSPRLERRMSVNQGHCGRRTSLVAGLAQRLPPCRQYTRIGPEIPSHFTKTVVSCQ